MEKRYRYSGPMSALPLKGRNVALVPGAELTIDAELRPVQRLVARGHLVEVVAPAPTPAPVVAPALAPTTTLVLDPEAPVAPTADESAPSSSSESEHEGAVTKNHRTRTRSY